MTKNKPYTAVLGTDDDPFDGVDGLEPPTSNSRDEDESGYASQALDLEHALAHIESRQNEKAMKCKLLFATMLVATIAFGGRELYITQLHDHDTHALDDSDPAGSFGGDFAVDGEGSDKIIEMVKVNGEVGDVVDDSLGEFAEPTVDDELQDNELDTRTGDFVYDIDSEIAEDIEEEESLAELYKDAEEEEEEEDEGYYYYYYDDNDESEKNKEEEIVGTISTAFSVLEQVDHDPTSFTQGLSYGSSGKLYETTGLNGHSKVRIINPETFEVEKSIDLDRSFFGEGSAFFKDKNGNARLIEITWQNQQGFIYDAETLEQLDSFQYTTTLPRNEGWGITYNPSFREFIVSDGSSNLYFWDRDTLEEKRSISVTRFDGRRQDQLNELEYMGGLICCNIWHSDEIICVDPDSGKSVREYDMSTLWPAGERGNRENVLNGIAIGDDHVLLTGKRWNRMYKIVFDDWSTLLGRDSVEESAVELVPAINLTGPVPDYFVPLSSEERRAMKDRLTETLMKTRSALKMSASNTENGNEPAPQRTLVLDSQLPKQFMHMHHMKTGGTSVDGLISCALRRQRNLANDTRSVRYSNLSECGSGVKRCMEKLAKDLNSSVVNNVFYRNDENGAALVDPENSFDPADIPDDDRNICSTNDNSVMSYCASLHAVRTFGWKDVDKITEMKDVLKEVVSGVFTSKVNHTRERDYLYDPNDSCAVQMIGHQATNLLSSNGLYNVANDVSFPREQDIVDEAIRNLREQFTWIGLTDRIEESVDSFREIFPFLAENLTEQALNLKEEFEKQGEQVDDELFSLPFNYTDKGCPFGHRNAGKDPACGTEEMDDETIELVHRISNRDVAVYRAAQERFEIQQEVLREFKESLEERWK
ncbi:hypothetical protein THAOC_11462 [Thalassiosira oceanica]|uniref:Uncharacterized protein n=1 Tax=Thalassiosira oceanica TaxID=159749 RepID=K0SMF9_THAOC|nr:hypothetical protein THAOC_11462 [Thalassiosira oceanica]|eukprot:EJK67498.1 hypothetical protein THAOC_11462 [Thalassiosira oceanica]